jgi:hypothetical protein
VRNLLFATFLLAAFPLVALGCEAGVATTDSRFSTPERTIETLLASAGLEGSTQEQNQARIVEQGGVQVRDAASYEACFADIDQPGGHGMAGYVLGMIAAASDDLRYEMVEGRGFVIPRQGIRIVMDRDANGAYRIVLAESVPEHVRESILQLEAVPSRPSSPRRR